MERNEERECERERGIVCDSEGDSVFEIERKSVQKKEIDRWIDRERENE